MIRSYAKELPPSTRREHWVTSQSVFFSAFPAPSSDDAAEFIRLEQSTGTWSIVPALALALGAFGDALIAGDMAAARGWLARDVELGPDLETRLRAAQSTRHRSSRSRAWASSAW